ncbi:MAG: hypothetical protein CFE26_15150, partial [Verrucomicrobiales bacterium VVV1]
MKSEKNSFIGLQSYSLPIRRLSLLALLSFAAVPAQGLTLLDDNFTNAVRVGASGSRTGVDRDGVATLTNDWVMAFNSTTAANQTSDANAPNVATGINGNSLAVTGATALSLHTYFTTTTLNAGESISVSLKIRATAAPSAQDTSFRVGLFDSNIGKVGTNSNFSGATSSTAGTVFIDDQGYGAFYDTGTTVAHEIRERTNTSYAAVNNTNLFAPTLYGNLGTASTVGNTIALNTTYTVTLDIARSLDGASVTTTSTFNGISLSYTDTSTLVTEFDHLALGFGSAWGGTKYIDDVNVTHTPAAPATLRAYYPFNSDFTDGSGNNNHLTGSSGTPNITTTSGEFAVGAGALNLDQSGTQEHLAFTTPIAFDGATPWSMAWWGKRSVASGAAQGMIAGTITDSNNFVWTPNNPAVGSVEGLRLRNSTGTSTDYDGIVDDNSYHHWAVVYNGLGSVEVWRDNVNLGSKAFPGNITMTHAGAGTASQTNSFFGQIDELYVYNGAIDAAKVGELFAARVVDNTAPTLLASGIVTTQGSPVVANTPVTFTVTFSEDMDAATVDASDFGNAGTAPISIGVVVTPTGSGSLQLKVLAGAVLNDAAGNPLATGSAIVGETSITVNPAVSVTRLRVYLLGGQSNADGRATTASLPTTPVNLQQPQNDVSLFYKVQSGTATLTTLRPGLSETSQFGPEITLGRSMADYWSFETGTRVAIIKYANGGTNLENQWKAGGTATTAGDGPEYVTFQQTVTQGLAALTAAYPGATLDLQGMVWMQGESDVVNSYGATYQANLTTFIADVRATYGADLPFIVGRLSNGQTSLNDTPTEATQFNLVRNAQTAVAAAVARVSLINTDGYG